MLQPQYNVGGMGKGILEAKRNQILYTQLFIQFYYYKISNSVHNKDVEMKYVHIKLSTRFLPDA